MTIKSNSISSLIGNTPLIELKNLQTGPCQLFVKMECMNLSGSLKDRMAGHMIDIAEKEGKIKPGDTIIEASSGNTTLALAHAAILRGYKMHFVVHDKISQEKLGCLHMLGAKTTVTQHIYDYTHPEYYRTLAASIAKETPNSCFLDQFNNPANPEAYEQTLAPELWQGMSGKVDAVIGAVGTGGHMTGIGRFMRRHSPSTKIILADPAGSILQHYFETHELIRSTEWLVEGIGADIIPNTCDLSVVDEVVTIPDKEAFAALFTLLKKESILAGTSSGTVLAAALRYCQKQTEPKRVVTFVYDGGSKYLSKICNKDWLKEHDLLDLI
ncbi:MAG: cysteine synthase family protein [Gammaproteobacteria bacterium]